MLAAKLVALILPPLVLPITLSAQVTLVAPTRTATAMVAPRVVETVVFDPTTKVATLGAAQIRRDLIGVSLRWNLTEPSVTHMTTIALGSSNWTLGEYRMRLEIGSVPTALRITRYWYVGTARQEQSCSLQPGAPGVCELPFTVEAPSGAIWFEIRSLDPNHGFDVMLGKMTVSRVEVPALRTSP